MFCNITITERATDQHIFHMYLPLLTVLLLYSPAIAFTSTIIAWLSLNSILEASWVALYSVVCLSVSEASVTPDQYFFQYIQAYKPFADPVPPNTKQYQLILTKYQPVSSYTYPVPSITTYNSSSRKAQFSQLNNFSFYDSFDESRTVYLVY